jgi:hypothetical protein
MSSSNKSADWGFNPPPFQSGDGICYPITYQNYYGQGGKKMKGGKNVSYTRGMDCPKTDNVQLDMRKNFGPFQYPPTEFAMNPTEKCGGKRKQKGGNLLKIGTDTSLSWGTLGGGKKSAKGGANLVGPSYKTEKLVPTAASKPSDLDYNGSFSDTRSNWKQALTGEGVPAAPGLSCATLKNDNLGVTYATAAGGAKKAKKTKKSKSPKKAKKSKSPKKAKKSKSPKKVKKSKSPKRKQRGGQETAGATPLPQRWFNPNATGNSGPGCTTTAYGQTNAVSGSCRNMAPCPNPSMQQTGGDNEDYSGATSKVDSNLGSFDSNLGQLSASTKGGNKKSHNKNMKARRSRSQTRKQTGGNGTMYQGASGCNKTTNMDNSTNFSPRWSECTSQSAGAKKVKKSKSPRKVKKSKSPKKVAKKSKSPRKVAKKSKSPKKVAKKSKSPRKVAKKSKSPKKAAKKSKSPKKVVKKSKSPKKAKKSKSPKKKATKKSKSPKKVKKSKSPRRKQKGGGSDWRMSQYSRGPVNYPSDPARFKQFTKTGDYISNRDLWNAAAPQLTGTEQNQNLVPPVAFNALC